jgi:hypothetical protein
MFGGVLNRIMLVSCNPNYFVTEDGRVWSRHTKKFLKQSTVGGYRQVRLQANKTVQQPKVHRLVAEAFIGRIPDGMHVCHCDGDRTNNRRDNLRIDTPKGNAADKKKHGTYLAGERIANSKVDDATVLEIRARLEAGERGRHIARDLGLSESIVSKIKRGRSRPHLIDRGRSIKRVRILTDDQAREVRSRVAAGENKLRLASEYGVSRRTIEDIVTGRTYKDV